MNDIERSELVRTVPCGALAGDEHDPLLTREWLVANGLGGYASGTISGVPTRRYHGLLVAALPNPLGRMLMLNHLTEIVRLTDRITIIGLGGHERQGALELQGKGHLVEFRLELGLPVWRYEVGDIVLEKRLWMPHRQNTVHIQYRLLDGNGPVRMKLRPAVNFRPHEAPVSSPLHHPYVVTARDQQYELCAAKDLPPMRMKIIGARSSFTLEPETVPEILYRIEESRGYDARGDLFSPGHFRVDVDLRSPATLVASTESWDTIEVLSPETAIAAELERRRSLVSRADPSARTGAPAELVLAADQFIISPAGRSQEAARAHAVGDEVRTVIAGYHWFTDWGRDTMISLEGLTLQTGRQLEAGYILRTFAHYVKDGLIPNMFPEGERDGLYHTADATMWFFHAIDRYMTATGDRDTLVRLLPTLRDIVDHHVRGTHFGIGVDPKDGLLRQGAEGYQLTWMDAKVEGWVVTPRRGKAVEINALWYNALRLLAGWLEETGSTDEARRISSLADRVQISFNERFWYPEGGYLYDVVDVIGGDDGEHGEDGEDGKDDPACRPNQILAIAPRHAVLDRARWDAVVRVVHDRLLTPVGLRSLAPEHADYKPRYYGDLRTRDAAYHQGTVWGWLIGPFIDAWLKVHPDDKAGARRFLSGLCDHLDHACIGSISEIFDAQPPFTARGCVAQAWSVAEALRCWVKTQG
ncbi:MAG: glycogen debranching enzyme family protein [Deltaproteobacteria bacterium]|nr:glycogen debranching enzyme family protein [Deltaproteobacteria bacterium]